MRKRMSAVLAGRAARARAGARRRRRPPGPSREPVEIGGLRLENRLVQAPLAGIANWAFRSQSRRHGAGFTVSEMIASFGIRYANRKTLGMLEIAPDEHPVGVQVFGADVDAMVEAARAVEAAGADLVDINMGCPVPKICKTGAGAALLADPEAAASDRRGDGARRRRPRHGQDAPRPHPRHVRPARDRAAVRGGGRGGDLPAPARRGRGVRGPRRPPHHRRGGRGRRDPGHRQRRHRAPDDARRVLRDDRLRRDRRRPRRARQPVGVRRDPVGGPAPPADAGRGGRRDGRSSPPTPASRSATAGSCGYMRKFYPWYLAGHDVVHGGARRDCSPPRASRPPSPPARRSRPPPRPLDYTGARGYLSGPLTGRSAPTRRRPTRWTAK